MTAANYCWVVFILGAFVLLICSLLRKREMPPPPERRWYGDENDKDAD